MTPTVEVDAASTASPGSPGHPRSLPAPVDRPGRRWVTGDMTRSVDTDYLVVGAGAAGMAFVDALVDHDPTAHATLVDRRAAPGGHWLDAYPFVRLHQASQFYGVASTRLGSGRVQETGPERGMHERATGPDITAYYAGVLAERLLPTGRVELLGGHEFRDGVLVDLASGPSSSRASDGGWSTPGTSRRPSPPWARRRSTSTTAPASSPRARCRTSGRPPRSSSPGRGRRRPTPWCGCSGRAWTRTRSCGCGLGTRGCSTARRCSRTRRCSSAWRGRSWPRPATPRPPTTCSCASRTPAS